MEEFVSQFSSLGIVGCIWYILLKKYLDDSKQDRLATVLYNLIECIRISTVILRAFMPKTAQKIFEQINTDKIDFDTLDKFGYYESGSQVGTAEVLFQRIDTKK